MTLPKHTAVIVDTAGEDADLDGRTAFVADEDAVDYDVPDGWIVVGFPYKSPEAPAAKPPTFRFEIIRESHAAICGC